MLLYASGIAKTISGNIFREPVRVSGFLGPSKTHKEFQSPISRSQMPRLVLHYVFVFLLQALLLWTLVHVLVPHRVTWH
ncbi:hypothetical protein P171DRAFT_207911 [Karstenula rhodostoma CBS 690.94]|uniref:Uncharacterized protein n=1 Tax=Karstenula rhodostoma CBS 690.94 TaxID=1392251 RepID=A0A9P4PSL4_9PLEO|nr:hypothetical protein P171DRAFT_207911 [Karstenula rhodostoma CBS 690.94]